MFCTFVPQSINYNAEENVSLRPCSYKFLTKIYAPGLTLIVADFPSFRKYSVVSKCPTPEGVCSISCLSFIIDCDQVLTCGFLTFSLPESVMETFTVIITFESVDEILWCDYSNETS